MNDQNEAIKIVTDTTAPRRSFLRNSLLLAVPAMLGGTAFTAAAAVYAPAARARGGAEINVRDHGARGNGNNDDTTAFQRAIDSLPSTGGTVYVPDGDYVIDPTRRVTLRSRMHLRLASGARLRAKRNAADRAYVLMVYKASDVEISGGQIIGDRDNHLGTTGEWGHGIQVRGSKRVTIRDMRISKCWGDGISIASAMVIDHSHPAIPSEDVVIANVVSTGNRRQALTIGGSRHVRVYDSEFSYTSGIAPGAGIDIEPDKLQADTTVHVHIENCVVKHNEGNGIVAYKRVDGVVVKNCVVEYNGGYGMLMVDAVNGYIVRNQFRHNHLQGAWISGSTRNYQFSGNTFRNNKTRSHGILKSTPLTTVYGLVGGNHGNGEHIVATSTTRDIRITNNYYTR